MASANRIPSAATVAHVQDFVNNHDRGVRITATDMNRAYACGAEMARAAGWPDRPTTVSHLRDLLAGR